MTDIKLPPMPQAIDNRLNDFAKACAFGDQESRVDSARQLKKAIEEHAREAVRLNAQAVPCCTNYAAGTTCFADPKENCPMLSAAPAAPQPAQPLTDEQINAGRQALPYDIEDKPEPWAFKEGVRFAEQAHEIGVKNER